MTDRLILADELAAYLGTSKATVYREWRRWGLTAYRVGRGLRFPESATMAWVEGRRVA